MLFNGIKLIKGSEVQHLVVDAGSSFPLNPAEGQLFYRNDLLSGGLHVYNGAEWVKFADEAGVNTLTGSYVPLAGGIMSGLLTLAGDPSTALQAAPKQYVDAKVASLPVTGVTAGTYGGGGSSALALTVGADGRVSSVSSTAIQITESSIINGNILARRTEDESIAGNWTFAVPVSAATPVSGPHLATKAYVDSVGAGATQVGTYTDGPGISIISNVISNLGILNLEGTLGQIVVGGSNAAAVVGLPDNVIIVATVTAPQFIGDVTGDVTGNLTGDVTGDVTGNLTGDVTGNVVGLLTGNVDGNVIGNLAGDVTGSVVGNVTGNLTGDVTGDVIGNLTGDVTGNLTGDVTGDVTGNLSGTVTEAVGLKLTAILQESAADTLTAPPTTTQLDAYAMVTNIAVFDTVPVGSGVRLPSAVGATFTIMNVSAESLNVYPAVGSAIGASITDDPIVLTAGSSVKLIQTAALLYRQL